jgi:hypothetical protein
MYQKPTANGSEQALKCAPEDVKYWELIANRLKKAAWSLGYVVSPGFARAHHLDCGRASRRRKALHRAC